MRRRVFSTGLILVGILCLSLATFFVIRAWADEYRAAKTVDALKESLYQDWKDHAGGTPLSETEDGESPTAKDLSVSPLSEQYIACLFIPALELSLPVQAAWSDALLRNAPCRYAGTIAEKNLIIAGHNYQAHFGGLKRLKIGDSISLVTLDGRTHLYTISEIQVLDSTALDAMKAGDWDLTLFTCTTRGTQRLTIRCLAQPTEWSKP